MDLPPELRCHKHLRALIPDNPETVENSSVLDCSAGCRIPVVKGIPRFVDSTNYASAFGLQWKAFQKTQLDSYTGLSISKDRLARCLGGSLDIVRDKSVLEVGCGAGRFTEVLLSAGARVFACDLSSAVEANYANCGDNPNYFVCQADVRHLPAQPLSFDFVVCIGVIQHTPDPEETIAALAKQIKPGGMLVIDHYSYQYPSTLSRRIVRRLLLPLPPAIAKSAALTLSGALLPVHRFSWRWSRTRGLWRFKHYLEKVSPLVDYYNAYPQLGTKLLGEWMVLDTHDTLTDYYKHFRNVDEIQSSLAACGLTDIEAYYGGNGVEARAHRPVTDKSPSAGGAKL